MRRTITKSVIIGFILLTCLVFAMAFYLRSKQPKRSGELFLSGLHEKVEVIFDKWAIPHLSANNSHDAFYALGYLHAQERLFQMEMLRRLVRGRLSEVLGEKAVEYDKFFRSLGIHRSGKKILRRSKEKYPHLVRVLNDYFAGVNEFIANGPTPIEYEVLGISKEEFSAEDAFNISGYMAYTFSKSITADPLFTYIYDNFGLEAFQTFLPKITPTRLSKALKANSSSKVFPQQIQKILGIHSAFGGDFVGSNSWAVSGKKSKSGKPILANDPHIKYSSPSVFYESYLEYPGFRLYGHYIAGIPFAIVGHGKHHGWGLTMLHNDDMHLYEEELNPKNSNQVYHDNNWVDLIKIKERIKVKGSTDISFTVKESPRGPIINDVVEATKSNAKPISLYWEFANIENEFMSAFHELSIATSLEKARSAVSKIRSPGLNVIYANDSGDIAWWTAGRFVEWGKNSPGSRLLLDAKNPLNHINKYHPFSWNPKIENPESGIIVSANNNPFESNSWRDGFYSPSYRYDRIYKLLQEKSQWSAEEIIKLQSDTSLEAKRDLLIELVNTITHLSNSKNSLEMSALEKFKTWDFNHKKDSVGATIFAELYSNLIELIFKSRLGDEFYDSVVKVNELHEAMTRIVRNHNSPWWSCNEDKDCHDRVIYKAWQKTIKSLADRLGNNPQTWEWGRNHFVEHSHILGGTKPLNWFFNVGPFPIEGSSEVVNATHFYPKPGTLFARSGAATRRVIDFANTEISWGVNPTGQSGFFANHHYRDQAQLYLEGKVRNQTFGMKRLAKLAKNKLTLRALDPSQVVGRE